MQEEIKEILDRLKDSVTNPIIDVPVMGGVSEPIDNSQCLEPNECKILLDYITNLQEENERLKKENSNLLNTNYWLNSRIDNASKFIKNYKHNFNIPGTIIDMRYFNLDELEKWLKKEQDDKPFSSVISLYNDVLDKLNKLKGDNK